LRTLLRVQAEAAIRLRDYVTAQAALDEIRSRDATRRPDWMVAQAQLLQERDAAAGALQLLEDARVALAAAGPEHELANRVRWEQVQVLRQSEAFPEALAALDATLRWQRERLPESHARVAWSRLLRVDVLRQSGDLAAAAREAEAVHRDLIAAYGERSAMAARSGAALGMALYFVDRLEPGIAAYREAREAWIETLGATHPQAVLATFNLGRMLESQPTHRDEAERLTASALRDIEALDGVGANSAVYMRLGLARILRARQAWPELATLLTSAPARAGIADAATENRDEHADLLRRAQRELGCPGTSTMPEASCTLAAQVLAELEAAAAAVP
jgi:tetratricopeptide (TPR) repeat protein